MKKTVITLILLILTIGITSVHAEEQLPAKLQQLTDEAYRAYSARETDNYFETVKKVKDAKHTSEAVHKAVEEFVGDAAPSDDLTKMCIKMK